MILALLIGREGSLGFPNKNIYPVLGRPLVLYPLLGVINSKYINQVYVSTDSEKIKNIVLKYKVNLINRPKYLSGNKALGEEVFQHGYKFIKKQGINIEIMVLLFANAPNILASTIDQGIEILRKRQNLDSAITVSKYNMFSPIRARKIGKDGILQPFLPFRLYPDKMRINCDRDSSGDVYFHDCGVSIVRPKCLEDLSYGIPPQRWMGRKIYPIIQEYGLDVDYPWQIPQVENWLKEKGFSKTKTPYDWRFR